MASIKVKTEKNDVEVTRRFGRWSSAMKYLKRTLFKKK